VDNYRGVHDRAVRKKKSEPAGTQKNKKKPGTFFLRLRVSDWKIAVKFEFSSFSFFFF
jgi:hypothetical protein